MKKLLLSFVTLCSFGSAYSQCVPAGTNGSGIAFPVPGTATGTGDTLSGDGINFPNVVQFDLPADTNVGIPLVIDSVSLTSIAGLPAGVTYTCNTGNCKWSGGTLGCMQLAGSPVTGAGFVELNITLNVKTSVATLPVNIFYKYEAGSVGINDVLSFNQFSMIQNAPNPFATLTKINFFTPVSGTMNFEVVNILGEKVISKTVASSTGVNEITVDGSQLNNGVYFYSLNNGSKTLTGKMSVSK